MSCRHKNATPKRPARYDLHNWYILVLSRDIGVLLYYIIIVESEPVKLSYISVNVATCDRECACAQSRVINL